MAISFGVLLYRHISDQRHLLPQPKPMPLRHRPLVFGGLGRIAFWRDEDGLRVGGMLATGIALLFTIAIIL